jgi:hypothetical protein
VRPAAVRQAAVRPGASKSSPAAFVVKTRTPAKNICYLLMSVQRDVIAN